MAPELVTRSLVDGIAIIQIDDGKRNALAPEVLTAIYDALDWAQAQKAAVIITGRESVFSAGFDLKVLGRGGLPAIRMLRAGFALTARVMAYPYPVVCACSGHCMAMGVFLMLSTDYVLGTSGDYKIAANEVAIGLPMPRVASTVLKQRLDPAAFQRAVTLSEQFTPDTAQACGLFDVVVSSESLLDRAREKTRQFLELDEHAHRKTKRRIRAPAIRRIKRVIYLDLLDAIMLGIKASVRS